MGVIACSRGFCTLEVSVAQCSSCDQWVCRDGRDDHIVLLTMTYAATVSWVWSMELSASEGAALTTCSTMWIKSVRRESIAGVLPASAATRSGRVLRNTVLVGLKLMTMDLPPSLFESSHCMERDGHYNSVSADSIWVGFGSGTEQVRFENVVEPIPET